MAYKHPERGLSLSKIIVIIDYYNPERFGYVILDGTQWELKIEYSNGRKAFTSGGSNSYPYNFKKLTELFGIEEADEIVEDEVIQD